MSTTLSRPVFLDTRWVSRLSLRTDNPDHLASHLTTQGFVSDGSASAARHHLRDTRREVHILVYGSGVTTWFAPAWDVLRPVITDATGRGHVR